MVERIKDLVIRTIISVEPKVTAMMQAHVAYPQNCYECFGFDVLLDENLRPWLVEVNTSPSLSSDSPLDKKIKTKLVTELFNVVGFRQYDRKTYKKDMEDRRQARLLGLDRAPPRTPMMNPPGTPQSTDLKNKKRDCLLKGQSPLENLNPEDLEMIVEAEVSGVGLTVKCARLNCTSRPKIVDPMSGSVFFRHRGLTFMTVFLSFHATLTCFCTSGSVGRAL